jgi:hypothetical protein
MDCGELSEKPAERNRLQRVRFCTAPPKQLSKSIVLL